MHVDSVRVGLFQGPLTTPDTFASVEFNLAAIDTAAREAAASGAKILLTPEMSATGYDIGELVSLRAEPADGPIFDSVAAIARSAGIAVVYGYPPELDGGRCLQQCAGGGPRRHFACALPQDAPVRHARPRTFPAR